jgi:drug/metabolite transporter (DMT)-like permease
MDTKTIGNTSLLTVGFLFGSSAVIVKFLAESMTPYEIVGWRFLIALFLLLTEKLDVYTLIGGLFMIIAVFFVYKGEKS